MSTLVLTLIHCMSAQNIEKGVDQIDLYLASGLGTSQDKIPKKTKCENLVDWVLNKNSFSSRIPYLLSCMQTPFGDIRVTDSESSCTLCSFVACVNANIDSCLLWLELNCMPLLLYLHSSFMVVNMSPHKLCFYHFPTRGRVGIKLGDVDTSKTYL